MTLSFFCYLRSVGVKGPCRAVGAGRSGPGTHMCIHLIHIVNKGRAHLSTVSVSFTLPTHISVCLSLPLSLVCVLAQVLQLVSERRWGKKVH